MPRFSENPLPVWGVRCERGKHSAQARRGASLSSSRCLFATPTQRNHAASHRNARRRNAWASFSTGVPWAISTLSAGHAKMRCRESRAARRLVKAIRNLRGTDGSGPVMRSSFATRRRQPENKLTGSYWIRSVKSTVPLFAWKNTTSVVIRLPGIIPDRSLRPNPGPAYFRGQHRRQYPCASFAIPAGR